MTDVFFIIQEADKGGFIASAVGESIFTDADTLSDLLLQLRDAVECHFSAGSVPAQIHWALQ